LDGYAGFLGMTLKFTEVTLSIRYRKFLPDGSILGGAMEYLKDGLASKNMANLGKVSSNISMQYFLVLGAIGAGNTFQVSQSLAVAQEQIALFQDYPYLFGLILASITGLVIIGGIKRIANVAEVIVPFMVGFYILMVFWVLYVHFDRIDDAFALIFNEAFNPKAVEGGLIGGYASRVSKSSLLK